VSIQEGRIPPGAPRYNHKKDKGIRNGLSADRVGRKSEGRKGDPEVLAAAYPPR